MRKKLRYWYQKKTGKMADCERERNLKIMMSMIKKKHDSDIKKNMTRTLENKKKRRRNRKYCW